MTARAYCQTLLHLNVPCPALCRSFWAMKYTTTYLPTYLSVCSYPIVWLEGGAELIFLCSVKEILLLPVRWKNNYSLRQKKNMCSRKWSLQKRWTELNYTSPNILPNVIQQTDRQTDRAESKKSEEKQLETKKQKYLFQNWALAFFLFFFTDFLFDSDPYPKKPGSKIHATKLLGLQVTDIFSS